MFSTCPIGKGGADHDAGHIDGKLRRDRLGDNSVHADGQVRTMLLA
jgi:hypothetical protein